MKKKGQQKTTTFVSFLKEKEQKWELGVIAGVYLLVGILFFIYDPYPSSTADSGGYLLSASDGTVNAWRPMGYSTYIQLVHNFSSSLAALYWVSYLLNALACIAFIFSVKYLFKVSNRVLFYVFAALIVLSPTLLFSSNFIMSDGLFCSLTTLWITSGLWVVKRCSWWLIATHLLLLIPLYSIRYVGLAYVPISAGILLLSLLNSTQKVKTWSYALLLLPFIVAAIAHNNIKKTYQATFKVDTISPFTGWQLLNNIAPILPQIRDLNTTEIKGAKERELHQFLMQFPDSVYTKSAMLSTGMMWNNNLPPKQYLFYQMQQQHLSYPMCWGKVGVIYENYAKQIIAKYPVRYFLNYIIPSAISIFNFHAISEWTTPFQSENFIEKYFNMEPVKHEHNGTIYPFVNQVRHFAHYAYWILGVICSLFFLFSINTYFKRREKNFMLLLLLGFVVACLGASCIASPNTVWRYSMPFYLPSMAFMLVILYDIQALIATKVCNKKQASTI